MELENLRKNVNNNLYSAFLNSKDENWKLVNDEYRYCSENISLF